MKPAKRKASRRASEKRARTPEELEIKSTLAVIHEYLRQTPLVEHKRKLRIDRARPVFGNSFCPALERHGKLLFEECLSRNL